MWLPKLTSVLSSLGFRMHHCVTAVKHAPQIANAKLMASEDEVFNRLKHGKCSKATCENTGTSTEFCRLMSAVSAGKVQVPCNCCPNCRRVCGRSGEKMTSSTGPK